MPNTRYFQKLAEKRRKRVRAKIRGTSDRPRLTIFRSNKYLYLQVIDDSQGITLAAVNTVAMVKTGTKIDAAITAAESLLKQLNDKNITAVIIDRGSYRYHGRVKAVAEALRTGKVRV